MPGMRRALVVLAVLSVCGTAHAGKKDRQTARLASGISASVAGAVTLGGFVFAQDGKPFNEPLLYTGLGMLLVGPSAGEFYAGQYLTIGMAVRAVGTGLAVWTLQTQTKIVTCDTALSSNEKCTGFVENAAPLLGIAAIVFIGGVWYDVLDAPDAADRYNKKHGFTATPTALVGPRGLVPGVALGGSF
jgi:hypothetical protein